MLLPFNGAFGQSYSAAREWNNFILEAIRNDYARPTVHARNLFHHAIISYDAWAAYDPSKKTYLLGDTLNGFICPFDGVEIPSNLNDARHEAIAFANFRLIQHRYQNSPDYSQTNYMINEYMTLHGYDVSDTSTLYSVNGPSALGNYLAQQMILYGYTDGSNELNDYQNNYYTQSNPPIVMSQPGNPDIQDPNRWQPITLTQSIDQSGNPIVSTPPHLSPEWGEVTPFSLDTTMYDELVRDGDTYKVYFDTYGPAQLNLTDSSDWDSFYKWNHTLVSVWQSHLDPTSGINWDISPASIGNNTWYPTDTTQYPLFYDLVNGGDPGIGHALNPITGMPYTPQIVPLGDYARVLAEFWADGIDSETPPGHWFEIYHYVTEQPTFQRKWQGLGPDLDTLEYDVKAQLTLAGAMHDAAICAWSLKGYYDYIRPVSAIRYMADQGQSSDTTLASYHPNGIPLLAGYVELVQTGDPLAGTWNENVGKIKLNTWRGHEYILDPLTDVAGVGWILAEKWWPYQRPTFVTPPFAGFVSGHSTFSRAGAQIMEFITGDEYFPGGLGEFQADQNEFLHFEDGPSVPITLQWATYRDASDQCSLSRIWGGIHPPIDDIPGRLIGEQVGLIAFDLADSIFSFTHPALITTTISDSIINIADIGSQFTMEFGFNVPMDTSIIPIVNLLPAILTSAVNINQISWVDSLTLSVVFDVLVSSIEIDETKILLQNLFAGNGAQLNDYTFTEFFLVDTKKPLLNNSSASASIVNDSLVGQELILEFNFDENCDTTYVPNITLSSVGLVNPTFTPTTFGWLNDTTYFKRYLVDDFNETVSDILTSITNVYDIYQNLLDSVSIVDLVYLDTENPMMTNVVSSDTLLNQEDLLSPQFNILVTFNEAMNTSIAPNLSLSFQGAQFSPVTQNMAQTTWLDSANLSVGFLVFNGTNNLIELDLVCLSTFDNKGNSLIDTLYPQLLFSDLKSPSVVLSASNQNYISDSLLGSSLYYIDTEFDERMDTLVKPLVSHFSSQTLTNSVQYNLSASYFIDTITYRAFFQVLDENIEIDSVHLKVMYAKDFSGNEQVVSIDSNFIQLDTKNPSVIGLFANDYILSQMNDQFNVVALMDETMSPNLDMNLDFNPLISLPLDLNLNATSWLNPTTFEFNYELLSPPLQTTDFDISINSGTDLAGNTSVPLGINNFFTIEHFLGLNESELAESIIYPTILKSGERIYFKTAEENTTASFNLSVLNSIGQVSQELRLSWDGYKYISDPIILAPGIYYLNRNNRSYKIIVFE